MIFYMDLSGILILPVILILFLLVHAFKAMRLYLILIDEKIPFRRFLLLYSVTTLVNLVVPFKLGEFFRIFVFIKATGDKKIGFLSVLLDRFFDTVALVLILLPYELLKGSTVSSSTLLLAVFVVVLVFMYISFPSFYTYLNRYIIMNRSSRGAMGSLKLLEFLKSGKDYVSRLIQGRYPLLIICSFVAWLTECGVLHLMSGLYKLNEGNDISSYIQSIISFDKTELMSRYVTFGIVMMTVCMVVTFIICLASNTLRKQKK